MPGKYYTKPYRRTTIKDIIGADSLHASVFRDLKPRKCAGFYHLQYEMTKHYLTLHPDTQSCRARI